MRAYSSARNALGFSPFDHNIDIVGIKRWIDRCDRDHTGKCHTLTNPMGKIPEATGLLFIDVEKHCLVKQPKNAYMDRYVALSYVWGTTKDPFQTLKANFDLLSKRNAFGLPENDCRLPKTIKDSILLVRTLGIQYLWVDRFCIVQDDEIAKPHQLNSMASIYSNAYFTIAATEGVDSNYGLQGLGKQRPRRPPFEVFEFSPSCRMIAAEPARKTAREVYHTRGWTFQEWTFSWRMIVFHEQTVTWVCQKYQQQENGHTPNRLPERLPLTLWTKQADPINYCLQIDQYSRRNLSNSADVLAAFSAFTTVQSRAMKGGILHGLPELFFNNMLCWHHDMDSRQQRRVDHHGNIMKQFPSWSWVGWFGPMDMCLASETSGIRMRASAGRLAYPCITEFYKLPAKLQSEDRELIRDLHYYEARGLASTVLGEKSPSEEPGDEETPTSNFNHIYSTVIEFRTRRLIARLSKRDCNGFSNDTALILGSEGQMIGALDLGLSFYSLDLPQNNVELICISVSAPVCSKHAHVRSPSGQYIDSDSCPRECFSDLDHYYDGIYEPASNWQFRCYDVLWIEWDNGIAYRKAIGQIWKEDWEAAETEEVDIRLG
ncbi:heterokaryon incompatibility protein-domain-containing protein [Bipolaris maydis]|nr:heterokaryon incompatibility protein-domain-containing protein [Bipolaris maydis]KAJ6282920.1 heterokaryon incompatibility protein-domain-containing protein [Bipolaris maydis]